MMMVKIAVSPMRTMVTACSFGVFGLFEDSTILIIWSTKVSPGLAVTLTVRVSLTTREPPISASPGAFFTGADSPVRSDSSTIAIPSKHVGVERDDVALLHEHEVALPKVLRGRLHDALRPSLPDDLLAGDLGLELPEAARGVLCLLLGERVGEGAEPDRDQAG